MESLAAQGSHQTVDVDKQVAQAQEWGLLLRTDPALTQYLDLVTWRELKSSS